MDTTLSGTFPGRKPSARTVRDSRCSLESTSDEMAEAGNDKGHASLELLERFDLDSHVLKFFRLVRGAGLEPARR